jgi:monoamine oxidase
MLNPDFPFSYDHYLAHPDGLGSVPPGMLGTEVAVIGAGLSGLVTAYELMKLGLRPVVYEADQIGGRLRTASFPCAPGVVADLGGMRFPESGKAFYHYVDLLGLETEEFPNPLAPATSSTVIELAGQKHYARSPATCRRSSAKWRMPGRRPLMTAPSSSRCRRPSVPGTPPGSRNCGTTCCR